MQEYQGKTYERAMTDDEKAWLRTWGQHDLIRANEEEFSGGAKEEVPSGDDPTTKSVLNPNADQRVVTEVLPDPEEPEAEEELDDYDEWTKAELEAEVAKRNADPENADHQVEVTGTGRNGSVLKEDLIKGLRVWDQESDTES